VLPTGLAVPAVHITGSTLVAGQENPPGQGLHLSSANSVLYVPTSHSLQREIPKYFRSSKNSNQVTASMAEQLTRIPRVREIESSNLKGRPNLTYTALQTVRHRFNIYACIAVLPWHYDAEMGTANSLHTSA